jgi:flagellar biosynthetic protein FliO
MPSVLQGVPAAQGLPGGYGASLLQALLALVAVCVIAWLLLRMLGRYGVGQGASGGRIRVLEQAPLDARRSLYLVQIGGRTWLVGAGEGAAPSLLAELAPEELPPRPQQSGGSFRHVLHRMGGRGGP